MKNNPFSLWAVCGLLLLGVTACDQCKVEIGKLPDQPVTPQPNPFRPPAELPPATQHGANTFGCRINGENWVFWIPPIALTDETSFQVTEDGPYQGQTTCGVRVWRDTLVNNLVLHHDMVFSFVNPLLEPRSFQTISNKILDDGNFRFSMYYLGKYYCPATGPAGAANRLIIDKIQQDSNIIAGRFNLVLYQGTHNYVITDPLDSIVITDGRFDFIYDED